MGCHGVCEGYDYDNADLKNVSVDTHIKNIDYISEEKIILTLRISSQFEFECSYFDESNSPWDSEEDCYWWKTYGINYESHNLYFLAVAVFKLENSEVIECAEIQPKIADTLEFDQDTLADRRSVDTDGFINIGKAILVQTADMSFHWICWKVRNLMLLVNVIWVWKLSMMFRLKTNAHIVDANIK